MGRRLIGLKFIKRFRKGVSDKRPAVACEDTQRVSSGDNGVTVTTVTPKRTAKPFSTFIQKGSPQLYSRSERNIKRHHNDKPYHHAKSADVRVSQMRLGD